MRTVKVFEEAWPLHTPFVIARGSRSETRVVVVELEEEGIKGTGECTPYPRYGESDASVMAQIMSVVPQLEKGLTREELQKILPAGAARNALDCALWELEAKLQNRSVWQLWEQPEPPQPVTTVFTLSLRTPSEMAQAAADNAWRPLLKLKLGKAEGDLARVQAVRAAAPHCRLLVDANTGWQRTQLIDYLPELKPSVSS